jgi:hypothetical protein
MIGQCAPLGPRAIDRLLRERPAASQRPEDFRDSGEVVVVVLRGEEHEVEDSQGLIEARVVCGALELRLI